ncbi:hypothetical protein GOV13_05430 [Candidatus Pacearchaeota archaeon]|nr:hypothetical protein [Candidatus Pacearchaeota archaeon]
MKKDFDNSNYYNVASLVFEYVGYARLNLEKKLHVLTRDQLDYAMTFIERYEREPNKKWDEDSETLRKQVGKVEKLLEGEK